MENEKPENKKPEASLIKTFKRIMKDNNKINLKKTYKFGSEKKENPCENLYKGSADIKYISQDEECIMIEAKSHHSKDAPNTRHKLIGQLLKLSGEYDQKLIDNKNPILGILIPEDSCDEGNGSGKKGDQYYREGFNIISKEKFERFGKLVNAKYVFTCSEKNEDVKQYNWMDFYLGNEPILKIFRKKLEDTLPKKEND